MKITFDEKACRKKKLTIDEALVIQVFRQVRNMHEVIENLKNKGLLIVKEGTTSVTEKGVKTIENILSASSGEVDEERLLKLAEKMRELYPAGMRPDRFGRPSPYPYRSNRGDIARKLKKFFERYGDYSDEEVLEATRRFVAAFNGDYVYLPKITYFISKDKEEEDEDGNKHKVKNSILADYLENGNVEDVVASSYHDWTSKMV